MTRALAKATQIDEDILAYATNGQLGDPNKITFQQLVLEGKMRAITFQNLILFIWHMPLKVKWSAL